MRQHLLRIFLLSFVILFLEVSLIRWLPSQVRALAYFKNLVLISSFLGLGLGSLLALRVRSLWAAFPTLFLLEMGLALFLGRFLISGVENVEEHLWLLYWDLPSDAPSFPLWAALLLFYGVNTLTFVPLGQLLGEALVAAGNPILAYSVNLLGSLAGTAAFVVVSFAEWGPRLWFVPILAALAWLTWPRRRAFALMLGSLLAIAAAPLDGNGTWSPYYSLSRTSIQPGVRGIFAAEEIAGAAGEPLGYYLAVNGSFHQAALDLSEEAGSASPALDRVRQGYAFPYRYLRERWGIIPREVLIIGAGAGNDAQIALEEGAQHVDAVEIDPVILRWGLEIHPNRPYADPRVRLHVEDGRTFLQNTPRRYDLVIFGTLDSQTLLSALSTIRLDNFVYTVESLERARQVTKPSGALALYFWVGKEWILSRLVGTLEAAFGYPPAVFLVPEARLFNLILIAPATPRPELDRAGRELLPDHPDVYPATDDWPYLYQQDRSLSPFYGGMILLLASLSALAVALAVRAAFPRQPGAWRNFHLPLFLQGAAFLLLETNRISILSLLFGSTWLVNAFVIGGILLVILVANLSVYRLGTRRLGPVWLGIAGSLLIGYFTPASALLVPDLGARLVGSGLVTLTPIFFSSMLFAILFRDSSDVAWAYGSNLLGSVVGGLAEFVSVVIGFRALNLVALLLYAGVVLSQRFRGTSR